ncbi:MAG: hypothetical protein R3Y21_02335 [Mycoplasmatota bacterium]
MKKNFGLEILSSLIVILGMLYFIPFLGVCLVILRFIMYKRKRKSTCYFILIFALLLLIPNLLKIIFNIINFNDVAILNDIINSTYYNNEIISYSKLLIIISVLFIIINYIGQRISNNVSNTIKSHISDSIKRDAQISEKNDLKIKEKQEKAKVSKYVKCPNCGSDNIITSKYQKCEFCRSELINDTYNEKV